jgi:hypothetical protein
MIPQNLFDAITGNLYSSSLAIHQIRFLYASIKSMPAPQQTTPTALSFIP